MLKDGSFREVILYRTEMHKGKPRRVRADGKPRMVQQVKLDYVIKYSRSRISRDGPRNQRGPGMPVTQVVRG